MIIYNFSERIFQSIDTPEKAYWLGFFYADGYLMSQGNSFGCALQEQDKDHLIKFLKFLNVDPLENCLKYQNNTHSYRWILTRQSTYQDLLNLGFIVDKSQENNLNVWNNIPIQYKKPFILGLWDGDGSFSITPKGMRLANFISNNDLLIEEINNYINSNLGENFSLMHHRTSGDPYPRIRFAQDKAKIFGDWLYSENYPFVLTRKYECYKNFPPIQGRSHSGLDNKRSKGVLCINSNKKYPSARACGEEEYGFTTPTMLSAIGQVCRKERKSYKGKQFRYLTDQEREDLKNNGI